MKSIIDKPHGKIIDFLDQLPKLERAAVLCRFGRNIPPEQIREQVIGKSRLNNHKPRRSRTKRLYVIIPSVNLGQIGSSHELWIRFELARVIAEELLLVCDEYRF